MFMAHALNVVPSRPAPAAPADDPGAHLDVEQAWLTPHEEEIVAALAEAAIPAGKVVPAGSRATVGRLREFIRGWRKTQVKGVRALLWSAELATVPTHARPFTKLSPEARARVMASWSERESFAARQWLRALLSPIKASHFDDPSLFSQLGCNYQGAPAVAESPRWLAQVTDGRTVSEDLELECEVVVVGTGAGGAAAAYELASRGRAVLLLEEGDYHRRGQMNGRASRSFKRMYRDRGMTLALGNAALPVFAGRAVGGSTVINSGTCYRTPERTFRYWRERHGMPLVFSSTGMAPYFARVESMLGVARADRRYIGGVARVIARGADAMGYDHQPLARNAPDCDGQGMCCYGCPTGAKRSTDVSYVPAALSRGAQLMTGARVSRVDIVAGRARGVTATLSSGATLKVKADAVIVAGGALMTPLLLARSKACQTSGWLGRNLSVHPASGMLAEFDEIIDMGSSIPQSYAIETFAEEGLMFEGSSLPPDITALNIPWTGRRFTDVIERYRHLALFGFMVQDRGRGSVHEGPNGSPLLRYSISPHDLAQLHRGFTVLSEVFLKAGAKRVMPFIRGHEELKTMRDVEALRAAKMGAKDFDGAAFHPLGTCRAGTDPRRSCVGPDHEAHDVAGLYVCDGSVMPSSLGVNPQITIMAMALRAAEGIDARLS